MRRPNTTRSTRAATLVAAGLWAAALAAQGDPLGAARRLIGQLQYDEARVGLETALQEPDGEARAQAYLLLAGISTDHKEARRLLREAQRSGGSAATQRAADLDLARLDYARGNYNSVRSRLEPYADDEARLLLAQAWIAIGEPTRAAEVLRSMRATAQTELLRGFCARAAGETRDALARLANAAGSGEQQPTVLLWKAECELQLGQYEAARATAGELQRRFADAPESVLIEPTLTALRQAPATPSPPPAATTLQPVLVQLGIFEARNNALRFRDTLPQEIAPLRLDEILQDGKRLHRVALGPFESQTVAEAYARAHLTPLGLDWRITRPEAP